MQYVIWGAGERGRRIYAHLGPDAVVAFADKNSERSGELYLDKKIISLEEYEREYRDYPIIISYVGEREGIEYLRERNITNYFLLSECPGEFQGPNVNGVLKKHIVDSLKNNRIYGIYGCTVYSLKVYDWVKENCDEIPCLLLDASVSESIKDTLRKYEYQYVMVEESKNINMDIVLICIDNVKQEMNYLWNANVEVEYVYDCTNDIAEYYNPEIEKFKNIHANEKCFIVATGPSLRMEDLEVLKNNNIPCFSMNHVYKAFEKTNWRPKYYVVVDYWMLNNHDEICNIDAEYAFLGDSNKEFWNHDFRKNHFRMHEIYETYDETKPKFSEDIARKCYLGYTVTYTCMQLAAYMGFKEIYLLGVDFSYGDQKSNTTYGHFFAEKKLLALGFVDQVRLAYQAAKEYTDAHGIKIYNATRGGKLEIFERVDFDSLF